MNPGKRAQLSTFLIIAVVVLSLFLVALFTSDNFNESVSTIAKKVSTELSFQSNPIGSFVQDCLEKETKEGILLLGLQGGEIYLGENSFVATNYSQVRIGYRDDQNFLSSIEDMELQLAVFLESNMARCLKGFSDFSDKDVQLEQMSFIAQIHSQEVQVNGIIPLTIKEGQTMSTLRDFSAKAIVPLGRAHTVAKGLVEQALVDPEWLDVSELYGQGFDVHVLSADPLTSVYIFKPLQTNREYAEFSFLTAIRLPRNDPPRLFLPVEEVSLLVNEPFEMNITVVDDGNFTLDDDAFFFDVESGGQISFSLPYPGIFAVRLRAIDEIGQTDEKTFTVHVEEEFT